MAAFFNFGKKKQEEEYVEDQAEDYLSIAEENAVQEASPSKDFEVRVFVLDDYEALKDVLDVIRNEKTLCLIDIHLLRNKDADELKRAIDKMKKTIEAVNGELIGFDEKWILAAPRYVHVHKGR